MATFYIDPSGVDTADRNGSIGQEWATLAYACTRVTVPGEIIHVNAGTYTETAQSVLSAGVSIMGAGETSIISSTYVGGLTMGVLQLSSPTEGSSGNQSISYLKFDGNVTGNVGIVVYRRSDVIIHHVTVENFVQEGIKYHGGSGSSDEPTIYATGNEIHNCTFNTTDDGHGAIHLNGQDGIKIYDNTFTGVQRTLGHDMNHIDMVEGYNKNIEIYNNTFTLPELLYDANGTDLLYNFHIETWDGMGGNKVYNNTFNGGHVGIDVGGHFNVKGASTFAWQIYGNTFQWSANMAYDDYGSFGGVLIEGGNEYIYVFNNHFKNIPVGINGSIIQTDLIHEYIYIYYNIFENIGFSSSGYNFALRINQGHATAITRYVYIYNNVIEGSGYCRMGIALESTGAMSYVEIRNNIIKDIVTYGAIGYWDDAGTIDNITITNNDLYNNNVERFYRNGKVVTNETYSNNITDDPLFVSTSDFHLQSTSPAINAGIDVGLTSDYSGFPKYGANWDIGAYEYQSYPHRWYISTVGSDTDGDGSWDAPWASLKHATDTVTGANFMGDTIMVGAGTYTETQQSTLGVGVSIMGAGETSIITTAAALDPIILLSSATQGTVGNQSISYIKMDGDLTALTLIKIFARSNVKIHDCTFIDAVEDGVQFYGRVDELYQFTTTYSTGNEFYNNTVTNCSKFEVYDTWRYIHGCFAFGGQDGMLIHDNTITQPDRGGAANGAAITFTNRGNHKGTKIYNNTLYTPPKKAETGSGGGYAFAIEMWSQRGGVEIYDNDITGAIDVGGYDTNDDGGYGYALKIYRNTIGIPALSAYNHYLLHLELGVHDGTFIYQNYFYNASRPITLSTTSAALVQGQEDMYFYYNIFDNVRKAGDGWFGYCFDINPSVAVTIHNLQILNNTVYAPASSLYAFIQSNDATTTFTDMIVRNNIVSNAHACVEITNGTVTGINVDNNNFYNTSHQTDYTGATVTGNTLANNITSDPLFVSSTDFHLQSTSPCINAGIATGLSFITADYDGQDIIGLPDIGAYEYSSEIINNDISILTINKFAII